MTHNMFLVLDFLICCLAGTAHEAENGELTQFQVTNLSNKDIFLYYFAVVLTGRFVIDPILDPENVDV